MSPSRRRVLGLSATLLVAGCVGSPPSSGASDDDRTDSPPPTTEGRGRETTTDSCQSGFHVSTDPFDPVSDLPADLDERERSLVAAAVAGEDATHTTYAQPPLSGATFVAYDGAFYRTASSVASAERVPAFSMRVEWERGQEPPADAAAVPFDDLPAADRDALRGALSGSERKGLPKESLSVREFPAPYPDGGDASRLVGSVTWVEWRDRALRVELAGESTTTRERRTYRYTVDRVAATPDAFRRFAADEFLVTLDDAPAPQREIVRTALDDTYEECAPPSDALAGLRERLAGATPLPDASREWYVALDGRRFRLAVRRWVQ